MLSAGQQRRDEAQHMKLLHTLPLLSCGTGTTAHRPPRPYTHKVETRSAPEVLSGRLFQWQRLSFLGASSLANDALHGAAFQAS